MRQPFAFHRGPDLLQGWIELPDGPGPHPAVLWVHGSGPTDVGHWGMIGHHPIFLDAGFAVIAWDKPGCGASSGTFDHAQLWRERADEVLAALAAARCLPEVDPRRIGCFGISQGGWVAPMAGLRDPSIAFAVLLSGPAHRADSQMLYLLREQLVRSGEGPELTVRLLREVTRAIARARSGAPPEQVAALIQPFTAHPVVGGLLQMLLGQAGTKAGWDHPNLGIDASELLAQVGCPVFAAFGERDTLVDWRESMAAYRTAFAEGGNHQVTIRSYAGADHGLLLSQTGLMSESAQQWSSGKAVVAPAFVAELRQWLAEHGGRRLAPATAAPAG